MAKRDVVTLRPSLTMTENQKKVILKRANHLNMSVVDYIKALILIDLRQHFAGPVLEFNCQRFNKWGELDLEYESQHKKV